MTVFGFKDKKTAERLRAIGNNKSALGSISTAGPLNELQGGSWVFVNNSGNPIPAYASGVPGTGQCVPYFVNEAGTFTELKRNDGTSSPQTVYNVGGFAIPNGSAFIAVVVGSRAFAMGPTPGFKCEDLCDCPQLFDVLGPDCTSNPKSCPNLDEARSGLKITISGFEDCTESYPGQPCDGVFHPLSQINGSYDFVIDPPAVDPSLSPPMTYDSGQITQFLPCGTGCNTQQTVALNITVDFLCEFPGTDRLVARVTINLAAELGPGPIFDQYVDEDWSYSYVGNETWKMFGCCNGTFRPALPFTIAMEFIPGT